MPLTNNIFKTIKHIYKSQTWNKRYGGQIWTVLFIFFVWAGIMVHLHSKNYISGLRKNWTKNRCLPYVLPIAGHVYRPDGVSALDYTAENFTFCINQILSELMELAMIPILMLMASISLIVDMILEAINAIRVFLAWFINMILSILAWIFGILANLLVVAQRIGAIIPDSFSKLTGVFVTTVHLGQSMFDTSLSGFKIAINAMIIIAIALIVVWFVLFIISGIDIFCFGCWATVPAALMFIANVIICTLLILCAVILKNAMAMANRAPLTPPAQHTNSVPNPACFAENTNITLNSGEIKKISQLKLGNILLDGGQVTSIMKCSSANQSVYNLYGIIVTGKHSVRDHTNKWIYVEEHPDAILISEYREPFVYCINTSTKKIIINDICFSDWDDLDEMDLDDIKNNCCANTPLPMNFTTEDLHLYLDSGFSPATLIELEDGRSVELSEVDVNDVLKNGEKVEGVVYIEGRDFPGLNVIQLADGQTFESTTNILICDPDLGNVNTYDCKCISTKYQPYFIHLLTNTKTFYIQGVKVGDYSTGIEKYLSNCPKTSLLLKQ